MSRRARALVFLLAALLAAAGAAAAAERYGDRVAGGYGPLRPVVVATAALPRGEAIGTAAEGRLEVRRVPARFVPPGALARPAEAVGLEPLAPIPVGAYLLIAQLRPPGGSGPSPRIGHDRRPVQIEVSGAEALSFAGGPGTTVDVVVTAESSGSGRGRTYVAAAKVPLLALTPAPEGSAGGLAAATLGLTRSQALRLIAAQSFARRVTVMPR